MKITMRDFKVFMFGMIVAFSLTLAVSLSSQGQQELIAKGIEIAVVGIVFIMIFSVLLQIAISFLQRVNKEASK